MAAPGAVRGTHHLTLSVGPAQEDYDFHTGLLGLKSVKKTVLFDGELAIYHLYYGNRYGDISTLLTSFPFRQAGIRGRRGSNQIKMLNLSVPADSLGFWADRFNDAGVAHDEVELFGKPRLHFSHPCGIEYSLVAETETDDRAPYDAVVPGDHAIRGAHGVTISLRDLEEMTEFVEHGLGATQLASEGDRTLFELGSDGYGRNLELVNEPDLPGGTWKFGEGTVHHMALDVGTHEDQMALKAWIEGLGYTDASESKDRLYFHSVYIRSPGGALVELAYSTPESFTIDEDREELGRRFMIPPQFEDRREEIMGSLETLETEQAAA